MRLLGRRRIALVLGVAAQAPQVSAPPIIRKRVRFKIPRPSAARAKIQIHRPGDTSRAIVRFLRRIKTQRRHKPIRRAQPLGGRFEGKQNPIIRVLREIGRMRRKIQQRLRFRPRPEEIPPTAPLPTKSIVRGQIMVAGAEEAHIYVAGAKRGEVQ